MTESEFTQEAELLRRELLGHCYRLSGSVQDAEDLVQETMLRAWRSFDAFRGDATVRTWLYRIATNVFLSGRRRRRHLPSDLGPPATDISLDTIAAPDTAWLEPLPDALIAAEDADPATRAVQRDQLRLALVASLQRLPPRQRGALLLCEALDWSAAEIGEALHVSVPAVKSLLQRARATLAGAQEPDADAGRGPDDATADALLQTYMGAFETSDVRLLERILTADAMLEMTPTRTWFAGRATCLPYLGTVTGVPGEWTMRPTRANGQRAAIAHRHGEPFGVAVLGLRADGLARISLFTEPAAVRRFR